MFFDFILKIVIKEDTSVGSRYSKPHFTKEPELESVPPFYKTAPRQRKFYPFFSQDVDVASPAKTE